MTGRPLLPSLTELKTLGEPRVHPNGFIQLDLSDEQRLHVWHPDLPYRQKSFHPVHNHVFSFTSHIFSGRLVHVVYDLRLEPGGPYRLYRAECIGPEESVLTPLTGGAEMRLDVAYWEILQPGHTYRFRASLFHETLANEPTLTIMQKHGPTMYQDNALKPSIVVPVGVVPDNEFRRDAVDTDVLWDLIRDAHPGEQT